MWGNTTTMKRSHIFKKRHQTKSKRPNQKDCDVQVQKSQIKKSTENNQNNQTNKNKKLSPDHRQSPAQSKTTQSKSFRCPSAE